MENKREDGVLTIFLPERIDAGNASDIEGEIEAIRKEADDEQVIFECTNLQYISSAGLRVIMKVVKQEKSVTVKEVSPDVYEIFDVSGFTNFITVEKRA
ncbi:MAG: STAS domain-containing protein [Solobacterium sp.]|nr:STAS domain-containing protein [Solobacterium sp.]